MISKKRKIRKSSDFKDKLFSILLGIIFFGIIGFLIFSNLRINQKRGEMREKIEELTREIQLLEEKNEQLKTGILQTESDVYWEARIREQGYVGPGEKAIVIVPPEEGEEIVVSEEKDVIKRLLDWILGRD